MARISVRSHPLAGTPEWVFPWRGGDKQAFFPRLVAVAIVGGAFTFLITTVRIQVDSPEKSTPRKASVIYLRDDAQGRALTLRAREGGPFPSRFEMSQWQGLPELEAAALDAARFQPPPYAPVLQDLPPENPMRPLELAAKGQSYFPERTSPPVTLPDLPQMKITPVLYPLSGVAAESVPPFEAVVDSAMASASWRFLVRLNADGSVAECVSLEKGGEAGAPELEKWLHRLMFKADPAKSSRWIALGVGFSNLPTDGPDAR
jgi:hypothetical protein